MKQRLFQGFGLLALLILVACSGGMQSVPSASNTVTNSPTSATNSELRRLSTFTAIDDTTGTIVRILPLVDDSQLRDLQKKKQPAPAPGTSSSNNLLYWGGPVQTTPHLYVVFWGSAWNSSSGDPYGVAAQLKAFYGVIGGSGWLNSVSQYYQSNGAFIGNSGNIFVGSYVDTSSSPPGRPKQSQLAAEAAKAAGHFGDYSASASYVVALPHGIHPSGFGTQWCAYHSTTTANHATIAWTNLPYMPDAGYSCGAGSVNNPGTLDGVTIVGGHEQGETETDPFLNAWYDSTGAENGDKCAWMNLIDNPAAGGYPTQPLWSNASSGGSCVQTYP